MSQCDIGRAIDNGLETEYTRCLLPLGHSDDTAHYDGKEHWITFPSLDNTGNSIRWVKDRPI